MGNSGLSVNSVGDANYRLHERSSITSPATISMGATEADGAIIDVSAGGAFIATNGPLQAKVNDGLRVRFRLPNSAEINIFARVRWVCSTGTTSSPRGFGIEFAGLGRNEKAAIVKFVEEQRGVKVPPEVSSHLTQKYSVQLSDGSILVRLNGSLNLAESQALSDSMAQEVGHLGNKTLVSFIDATHFLACPEESLPYIKEGLAKLGCSSPSFGVMVGSASTAMLQMRRLLREAGVAETIVCFENQGEALEFWEQLQDVVHENDSESDHHH